MPLSAIHEHLKSGDALLRHVISATYVQYEHPIRSQQIMCGLKRISFPAFRYILRVLWKGVIRDAYRTSVVRIFSNVLSIKLRVK